MSRADGPQGFSTNAVAGSSGGGLPVMRTYLELLDHVEVQRLHVPPHALPHVLQRLPPRLLVRPGRLLDHGHSLGGSGGGRLSEGSQQAPLVTRLSGEYGRRIKWCVLSSLLTSSFLSETGASRHRKDEAVKLVLAMMAGRAGGPTVGGTAEPRLLLSPLEDFGAGAGTPVMMADREGGRSIMRQ